MTKLACVPETVYQAMEVVLERARDLFAPGEVSEAEFDNRCEALQMAVEQADVEIEKVSAPEVK